ncbi:Gfo/Idh/MocA family protein [Celerinatantimonas yamalensis]|uniref:Gfo/Idh/MocA family oxidoreductase n=1 Tax=Celerinatantimonas yamalensis TaxID=559956 RepID=A0ABW9G947_9GAMM
MNHTKQNVNWGIAGLGHIARRFATALTNSREQVTLYAVAARDLARANVFGEEFDCDCRYGCYEEMAQDPHVDAVYISTIHPYHRPLAELFLRHKKHVLVEKPAFTNLSDWLAMRALAKQNDVLLLEAMKTVTFPAYRELKAYLVTHQLQLTSIEACFGNQHVYQPDLPLFNAALSGGATLDVGVYGLWLYCDLCKTLAVEVEKPAVNMACLFANAHIDTDAYFTFSGKIHGKISASIAQNQPRSAILRGDQLLITIQDKWWNPYVIDIEYKGSKLTIESSVEGNGFEFEIDHFSQLILAGKKDSPILLPDITAQVLSIMERSLTETGYSHLTLNRR